MTKIYNSHREIDKDLKDGRFYPVYFFYGEDDHLIREYEGKLKKAVHGEGADGGLMHETFYGGEDQMVEIVNSAMTLPMLIAGGSKKTIIVRNAERLNKADIDMLCSYADDPNESTILFVSASGFAEGGGKSPLKMPPGRLKELLKSAAVATFERMKEGEVKSWVVRKFRDEGKTADPEVLDAIIDFLGSDLSAASAVVEKLLVFLGDEQRLTFEDVEDMIPDLKVHSVFEMSDALSLGDAGGAIKMIEKMLLGGAKPVELLGIIRWHFVRLWSLKVAVDGGESAQGAARGLKIPSFALGKYVNQINRISHESFREILKKLFETDRLLKSGSLKDRMVIDKMVLDITSEIR